jgi:hypothetical protein
MKKFLLLGTAGLFAASFGFVPQSRADTLLLGQLSFDSGLSVDGNTFDLYNFTGNPGFSDTIVDNLVLSGTLVVTPVGGAAETFTFSGYDDSNGGPPLATIDPSISIASAVLSVTLSNSTGVNILDDSGNPAVVNLAAIADTSLAGGSPLTPCDGSGDTCSQAALYVDTANTSITPEPGTLSLLLTGIGGVLVAGTIRRTQSARC